MRFCLLALAVFLPLTRLHSQASERARDLGIPLDGIPGNHNAITDVPGVKVGHVTLVSGAGRLVTGKGPVRTGVTAIFPRSDSTLLPVFAGWFSLNGNGEMTGTTWIEEYGELLYPVVITNTNSVGIARDALIDWGQAHVSEDAWNCCLPVVAETWDGDLNDIFGFHVTREHVFTALANATSGPVTEGNVGGGTGMECLGFKGGIGTSSRRVKIGSDSFTVGVLVQCNFGARNQLRIAGIPMGREITAPPDCYDTIGPLDSTRAAFRCPAARGSIHDRSDSTPAAGGPHPEDQGSIIVIVATDAPLLPHQLKRLAKRASLGIGRMGGVAGSSSGDIFLAFSTRSAEPSDSTILLQPMLNDQRINGLYEATVQATEESIINAMLAARTMTGANDLKVTALPHDQVRALLSKYHRSVR
ncbi:MAG: P1 family peptidase [Gemmatimonadota bacterium]